MVKIREMVREAKLVDAEEILEKYCSMLPQIGKSERYGVDVACNAAALAVCARDENIDKLLFEKLIPKKITEKILAYNLACFYSNSRNERQTSRIY